METTTVCDPDACTRRTALRWGAALAPAALAGCPSRGPVTAAPCPTPDEPLFRDVAVHNERDRRRSVAVTVTVSGRRVLDRTFDVPPGGDAGTDGAVFARQAEHVVAARLGSGVSASLAVAPTYPAWRFYNGVAVDVAAGPDGADLLDVRQPHGERPLPPC